jgi:hypothetical protein
MLKSRPSVPALFPVLEMVEKNITIQAVHYGNALDALSWLETHTPHILLFWERLPSDF